MALSNHIIWQMVRPKIIWVAFLLWTHKPGLSYLLWEVIMLTFHHPGWVVTLRVQITARNLRVPTWYLVALQTSEDRCRGTPPPTLSPPSGCSKRLAPLPPPSVFPVPSNDSLRDSNLAIGACKWNEMTLLYLPNACTAFFVRSVARFERLYLGSSPGILPANVDTYCHS